ncbi:hypothetical protein [Kangiella sp. M94]
MKVFKLVFVLGLLVFAQKSLTNDKYLVLKGKILSLENTGLSKMNCDVSLCMNYYFRYNIKVTDSLQSNLQKEIKAVSYQHSAEYYYGSKEYLFVLTPINNEQTIRLLGASYYIEEKAGKTSEFCLQKSFKDYAGYAFEKRASSEKCITDEIVFRDMKYLMLREAENKVIEFLEAEKTLLEFEVLSMDKQGKLYYAEEEEPTTCTKEERNSYDVDKIMQCYSWEDNDVAVLEFKIKRGSSSQVVLLINNELERLPFTNIKSDIVVETKDDIETVRWTYEIL